MRQQETLRYLPPAALNSAPSPRTSSAVREAEQVALSSSSTDATTTSRIQSRSQQPQPQLGPSAAQSASSIDGSRAADTLSSSLPLAVRPLVRRSASTLSPASWASARLQRDLTADADGPHSLPYNIWQSVGSSDDDNTEQSRPLTGSSQRSPSNLPQSQHHATLSNPPLLTWRCGLITAALAVILLIVPVLLLWTFRNGEAVQSSSSADRPIQAAYSIVIPPAQPASCLPCECPCDAGPYVLLQQCKAYDEGIGSMMQHMKMALTIAKMASWSFIADRSCFLEGHLKSDVSDRLGLYRSPECDACSLANRSVHSVTVDFSVAENWRDAISGWVTCPVLTAENKQALSTFNTSRIDQSWFLKRLLSDIFSTVRQLDTQQLSHWVFGFQPTNAMEDLNSCFADLIHDRYERAFRRQVAAGVRSPLPFDHSQFNIAVHFRWGDVSEKDIEAPDGRSGFGLSSFRAVVASILSLKAMANRTRVWFFSEGSRSTFSPFLISPQLDLTPITTFRLGEKSVEDHSRTFDDLDLLAHSDVLIGGQSSFFAIATQLAGRKAIVIGNPKHVKFFDHSTGFYSSMLLLNQFNLTQFEQQLRASTKYARIVSGLPGRYGES